MPIQGLPIESQNFFQGLLHIFFHELHLAQVFQGPKGAMVLWLKRPGFKQAILEILVSTFTCPQLGFSHHVFVDFC